MERISRSVGVNDEKGLLMQDNENMAENLSGGETASTNTPFAEEQTSQEGFLAGFSDDDFADGQTSEESDSKGRPDGDTENNNIQENQQENHSGRPDKRSRSNERIQQLLAEKRERDAELAEYREWKAKQDQPQIEYDEDGNVSVESMNEYNRKMIQQEIERANQTSVEKIQAIEREKNLDNSISTIESGIKERVLKHDFLNPDNANFDPNISKLVTESVLGKIQSLQLSGFEDYSEMASIALEEVDRQLDLIETASKRSKVQTANSLSRMQGGGAIVSSNHGQASSTADPFLEGFLGD